LTNIKGPNLLTEIVPLHPVWLWVQCCHCQAPTQSNTCGEEESTLLLHLQSKPTDFTEC